MGHVPDLDDDGPLPDIYRSRQAFFASLPAWRRFLAKLNWRPIIDSMVAQYHHEQAAIRREQALNKPASQLPLDDLLADFDAELVRRAGQGTTTMVTPAAKPAGPALQSASTAARQPSWRNAGKATLLLLLGIGIAIPLFTSGLIWLVILVGSAGLLVFGVLGVIWKAIYDTLQEGDQPPQP